MKKAIGIDLGTTNSVVAFKDTSVKIIRNRENEELTRSCVGMRKGEILVGTNAYQLIKHDPINTILSVKRLMGGAIKDKMVQDMVHSPYYKFGITSLKGGTDDAVAVVLGGKQYTPEQISAEILKKLKTDAEERLGDEVTHAVITVPAYFTEKQKNATRLAAQMAGLKVQKLLAEPTAAAIAYGVDNMKIGDSRTVMIYDFGGGTFDLSILNIVDGQYMEAGTGGDRWLGGDDIDMKLQELIIKKFENTNDAKIENIKSLVDVLVKKKKDYFEGDLRIKTENGKIQLSSAKSTPILIDILEDENGDVFDIDVTIKREEFETVTKPFIERSIELIGTLLKEVGYDMTMIDSILLVGGTSCIPLVKHMLSEKFGADKIKVSEKPMLAIAEGAAILAHRLGDEYETPIAVETSIADISYCTNHNYFIEVIDENEPYDKIIEKQMPLPYNVSKPYKTTVNNQRIVKVGIFADVEDGKKELQTMGFFTIKDDLPKGSDIIFDITVGIDEIFEVMAYPKNDINKTRKVFLTHGGKDSKTLEFLSDCLQKMLSGDYSEKQRDFFFKSAKKEIEKINSFSNESSDSEKWEEIGTNTFSSFEQVERITDDIDEDEMSQIFAAILLNEYPELLVSDDANFMRKFLSEAKNDEDPLTRIRANQRLKELTDEYPVLITLFTVKIGAEKVVKTNPTIGHRLMQMHDQIVIHFKNRRKDDAYTLLNEAIELRDEYDAGDTDFGSIHLKK
jgi:molecular chaperone DnaK